MAMDWTRQHSLRVAHGGAALLFAASAFVQANDPDPLRWMALYGLAAAAAAVGAHGRWRPLFGPALLVVVGVPSAAWLCVQVPGSTGIHRTELLREIGGLVLVCGWMAVLLRQHTGWPLRGYDNRGK